MSLEVVTFPDRRRLYPALAAAIGASVEGVLAKKSKAALALPGGMAAEPLYEAMSNLPLAWERVSVVPTDERWVSTEDPASNEYVLRRGLIRRRAAAASLISLKTNHARPGLAANAAERRIAKLLPFDVCVLIVGSAGQVASLIPGAEGYEGAANPAASRSLAAVSASGAAGSSERLTLTLAAILASRNIFVLLAGQDRIGALSRLREGTGDGPLGTLLAHRKASLRAYCAP